MNCADLIGELYYSTVGDVTMMIEAVNLNSLANIVSGKTNNTNSQQKTYVDADSLGITFEGSSTSFYHASNQIYYDKNGKATSDSADNYAQSIEEDLDPSYISYESYATTQDESISDNSFDEVI